MSDHTDRERSYTAETEGHSHESKSKPGAKPRASRAGTRSVTTLNAEQLARKRANDREAQRAIRQRTREHIERLENRIKELSENNPESDAAFEAVQRRNAELEEELRQLRKTLYGMGEGSHSPAAQHHAYLSDTRVKMEAVSYPPQWGAQGINPGLSGYAPTSNPVPEPQHAWQPHLSHQNPRRSHHQSPSHMQPASWSRNDSSDSDYDSAYGLEQEPVGMSHPVRAHPEHLQNFYMNSPHSMDRQAVHHGRQDVMWQHPNGPTSNGPFEGSPHLGIRDDRNTYGTNTPYTSQPSTPGWSPNLQSSNLDAYF